MVNSEGSDAKASPRFREIAILCKRKNTESQENKMVVQKKLTENGSGKATLYVGNIKDAMPFFMGVVHMLCSIAAFLEDS